MSYTLINTQDSMEFIHNYFSKLGYSSDVTTLYIALHSKGPQTISELARSSGIERTRIYRLTDELTSSGLVEMELHYKRSIYKAAPISNLHIQLTKKEHELKELKTGFDEINDIFSSSAQDNNTHAQFYHGVEGTKQIFWNESKAKSEVLVILFENMQSKTNSSFFERWVRRCNERGIHFRGIVNDSFISTQKDWYATHSNEQLEHWQARHVSEEVFPINHSMITYDDVVVHQNWKDGDEFGLEIYNQDIASTQRRYFELLWNVAQPIDNTSSS